MCRTVRTVHRTGQRRGRLIRHRDLGRTNRSGPGLERAGGKSIGEKRRRKRITCADGINDGGWNRPAVGPFAGLKQQAAGRAAGQGNQLQMKCLRERFYLLPC